jgi:hypothetical protein
MDTSVTLIGLAITALIAIPLYKVIRANAVNHKRIKEIMSLHPKFKFDVVETLNKKTYALDEKQKGLLFIDFNYKPEKASLIDLNEVNACRLVPTTENFSGEIIKIEMEFLYQDANKASIPVYNIEHDQMTQVCLHEDQELAKKWQNKIILAIAG